MALFLFVGTSDKGCVVVLGLRNISPHDINDLGRHRDKHPSGKNLQSRGLFGCICMGCYI